MRSGTFHSKMVVQVQSGHFHQTGIQTKRLFSQTSNQSKQSFKLINIYKYYMHVHKINFIHIQHIIINQNIHFIKARHTTFYYIVAKNILKRHCEVLTCLLDLFPFLFVIFCTTISFYYYFLNTKVYSMFYLKVITKLEL